MIEFFLKHNPAKATAQQKGACRTATGIRFFEKAKVKSARETLVGLLLPHVPAEPLQGALIVSLCWHFPFRKSEKKSIVKAGIAIPHQTTPDLDNLEKLLLDNMTRLRFWNDDKQIYIKSTAKYWSATPGITVSIYEFEESAIFNMKGNQQ